MKKVAIILLALCGIAGAQTKTVNVDGTGLIKAPVSPATFVSVNGIAPTASPTFSGIANFGGAIIVAGNVNVTSPSAVLAANATISSILTTSHIQVGTSIIIEAQGGTFADNVLYLKNNTTGGNVTMVSIRQGEAIGCLAFGTGQTTSTHVDYRGGFWAMTPSDGTSIPPQMGMYQEYTGEGSHRVLYVDPTARTKEIYGSNSMGATTGGGQVIDPIGIRVSLTGATAINALTAAPADATLFASSISPWIDESGGNIEIKAKYSNGSTINTTILPAGATLLANNGDAGSLTNIPAANLAGNIAIARMSNALLSPGGIGGTTPNAGKFTTMVAVSYNGNTVTTGTGTLTLGSVTLNAGAGGTIGALGYATPGTGIVTWATTPSSANLASALTDETGTGVAVFSASPALTGTPTAPTATVGTNTTQLATTAFVLANSTGSGALLAANNLSDVANAATSRTNLGLGDMATQTSSAVNITGGTITGTTIGGNTLTSGTFTITGGSGKTLTFNNTLTLNGTNGTAITFPSTSATVARTDAAQTFTGTNTFGAIDATSIGATTRGTGAFTTLAANGATTLTAGTATTSSSTGTLVVTGGIGSSGAMWSGGNLATTGGAIYISPNSAFSTFGLAIGSSVMLMPTAFAFEWSSTSSGSGTIDTTISRNAAGIIQVGTTAANGLGQILCAGIIGTTAAGNATAGNLGESVSSLIAVGSAVGLTTATPANITSISLTAGDWDVTGCVDFTETVATASARSAGISTTSATIPTDGSEAYCGVQSTITTEINSITPARKRVNVSSTTTVYLVGSATFSAGTVAGFGNLTARRVR